MQCYSYSLWFSHRYMIQRQCLINLQFSTHQKRKIFTTKIGSITKKVINGVTIVADDIDPTISSTDEVDSFIASTASTGIFSFNFSLFFNVITCFGFCHSLSQM